MKKLALALVLGLFLLGLRQGLWPTDQARNEQAAHSVKSQGTASAENSDKHHPKTWRALLENAVLLTAATVDYWFTYGHFTVDWEFTLKEFWRKFFTAQSPKLDSNAFWFNWSHAVAGAAYYSFARASCLNNRISTLFSFGGSLFWESVSEWRELISTNDMIFSSLGGPAIGEPLFQVSSVFSHGSGLLNELGSFIFNPFLFGNNWFDRGNGSAWNSAPRADWHRFRLVLGLREDKTTPASSTAVAQAGTSSRQFNVGLDMETKTVPGYGTDKSFSRFLSDTLWSSVFFDMNFTSLGLEEFNIRTQAVLFGYGWQTAHTGSDNEVRGSSAMVGYGTAFEVSKKRAVAWYDSTSETEGGALATVGDARFMRPTPTSFTDKLADISPLGAVAELSRFGPRLNVRWRSEVFGDFAMVNALAYNRYTESHDPSGVKTTLLSWGYYYALGMTLASNLAVDLRRWELQAAFQYQWFDSIQNQDRYQYLGQVTNDFKIRDTRLFWRLKLAYELEKTPFEIGLVAEGIDRRGHLLDIHEYYKEYRIYYQLAVVF